MPFTKWPDIEALSNVVYGQRKYMEVNHAFVPPVVTYRGKVKLDGTNAAVRISRDGTVTAQSRTQDITTQNDNCGFARYTHERAGQFNSLTRDLFEDCDGLREVIIYGEWVGKGIQKGTVVSTVAGKHFCVFAIQEISYHDLTGEVSSLILDIEFDHRGKLQYDLLTIDGIKFLDWEGPEFRVDFNDKDSLNKFSDAIEKEVLRIEACDPWVKTIFGVQGIGEGIVYYPVRISYAEHDSNGVIPRNREEIERLMFKAKGQKHRVKVTETAAPVDIAVLANTQSFIDAFVTVPRLEQGVTFVGGADIKKISDFLKWFSQDVEKESKAELEASGLTWKQVVVSVQKAARDWFIVQTKKL